MAAKLALRPLTFPVRLHERLTHSLLSCEQDRAARDLTNSFLFYNFALPLPSNGRLRIARAHALRLPAPPFPSRTTPHQRLTPAHHRLPHNLRDNSEARMSAHEADGRAGEGSKAG